NATLSPNFAMNETTWFRIIADNGVGCISEDIVQITAQPRPESGVDGFVSLNVFDSPVNLFSILGGNPDTGGDWSGPSVLSGGSLGTFDPSVNASGLYTYEVNGVAPCGTASSNIQVHINTSNDTDG